MELVLKVAAAEALAAALDLAVDAVAVRLPPAPPRGWWAEAASWRGRARERGVKFYLVWDRLVRQAKWPQAMELLTAAARLAPDALVLRDLGLAREAQRLYPNLARHGAGNLGLHNSPGLESAAALGFSRVRLEVPVPLKDLALVRRETAMPLEVALPPVCLGGPGFSFEEDSRDPGALFPEPGRIDADWLSGALEMLPALAQLGVEAVQVGPEFTQAHPLKQVAPLFQAVLAASPGERSGVLAAAREVWAALGPGPGEGALAPEAARLERSFRSKGIEPPALWAWLRDLKDWGRVWLEARGYGEAAALAREWRGPLVVLLTPEDYAAFLPEHRRWQPRRLVWRLPVLIPETSLTFYRQAIRTLTQGGFGRFVAGDWGGAALVRAAGGAVYADQTLGLLNSGALDAARAAGVARFCLPPGARAPEALELIRLSPPGSFWGYLYQVPALAVWFREGEAARRPKVPAGRGLRWAREGNLAVLCPAAPVLLTDPQLLQRLSSLVISLPRSGLPWGRAPFRAAIREPRRPRG